MADNRESKCFTNIAFLVRTKRINHPKGYSQMDLSRLLGYKNGQFISNVERGLCGIPFKKLPALCDALEITNQEALTALKADLSIECSKYLDTRKVG